MTGIPLNNTTSIPANKDLNETFLVYDDPKTVLNDGKILADYVGRQPAMFNGHCGILYHREEIKIGDIISLIFNSAPVTDGTGIRKETGIVTSIRHQYWNGLDDHCILQETIPSCKSWIKIITIQEQREEKINTIIDGC